MAVKVLISGLLVYDSGKTWLGVSLVKRLIDLGYRVGFFKPVAGHSAWHQYRTVVESFRRGVLVGEDVVRYLEVVEGIGIDVANPVDILLAPLDLAGYAYVYDYLADMEDQVKQMVLARASDCRSASSRHFVFAENLARTPARLRKELEDLALRLRAERIGVGEFVGMLRSTDIEENLALCLEAVERGRDFVVIESFNNAIAPFRWILGRIDALLAVAPGIVAVYKDIERLSEAVDRAVKSLGEKGFESAHALGSLKPEVLLSLRPRTEPHGYDESLDLLLKHILAV